jgi:CHAT domain-containing protein
LAEAGDVVRAWHDATRDSTLLLSGAGAQETRFKQLAPGKRALHLATHGFFLGAGCDADAAHSRGIGGMAPAGSLGKPAAASASVTASPLRLSGLALAGANHRADVAPGADDGVLTSEEIAALDLSSVREVVLSACDTGEGDVAAGEGVLGLQRAFRLAGARSLVMSLWAIDDHATREWMRHYYASRLTAHTSVAAAVRSADRARIAALRAAHQPLAPAAWAGFVASDAGR